MAFFFVIFIEFLEVSVYLLVDFLQAVFEPGAREIAFAGVGGLEFGTVEGYELAAVQTFVFSELNVIAAEIADGPAIGLAEIGDGFCQPWPDRPGKSKARCSRSQMTSKLRLASRYRARLERMAKR
jgi:hypothetical protein